MPDKSTNILLVEDNPGDARLVREMLTAARDENFAVDWVPSLFEALEHLDRGGIDLVLLDLGLPDSQGLDTFLRAYEHYSHLPFLVLTGYADETLGSTAVRQGAQDYLPKGEVAGSMLCRAIRYAIERKRAEIALEAERKKLFSLLNNLPAFVYLKGKDFTIRFANHRFTEIFGEPENKPCYEVIRGRSEPCEGCHSLEVLKTKVPKKFEFTTPFDARTYEVYNYPFCVDDGLLVLTLGIDITERKRMEKALQRQQEEQQIILDSVPAMIFFKDTENRFVRVNKTLAEALASTVEEVEGKTLFELFPDHAEDYWKDDLDVVTYGNHKRNIIESYITAAGLRWVQTDKIPYRDEEGNIIGIIGFSVDITERLKAEEALRESEERFRAIFDQAAVGVAQIETSTGRFIRVNQKYCAIVGLKPEEMTATTFMAITHPDDLQADLDNMQRLREGLIRNFSMEKRYVRQDGSLVWVNLTVSPMWDIGQPLNYHIAVVEDITERKHAEGALQSSKRKLHLLTAQLLTAQEDERRRISSELHDELGHALLTLKLNLRSIERELQPDQQTLAEEIESLFHYIDEVVENVRRLYLDLTPGDVEDLGLTVALQTLVDEFAMNNQKIQWSVSLANIDNRFTLQSQTTIYRIFQEILTNIGKHADPSHVSVSIKENDMRVLFEVEDNGRGFSDEAVHHYPKIGVGLLAMEERVRMLGGAFEIWSRKNHGTRITFSFPLSEGGKLN
jgi:PAS domain S-box-containing protein